MSSPMQELARELEIDRIADRFESAWQSGERPDILKYTVDLADEIGHPLLWELVQLDIEYRRRHGESCQAEDYLQLFPQIRRFLSQSNETPADLPRIPRYEIVRLIGTGGMGAVWEARQQNPHRAVALKVIRPGMVSRELLRRFSHEAEILGRLKHIGIAQIYEAGTFDGDGGGERPFLAMELIRGVPINDYANAQQLDSSRRLALLARVCDAVQSAHENGIIHRDLKPGNVLVDETGQPKILDFGVARIIDGSARMNSLATDTGQLLGTLPYMSPEQAEPRAVGLDARADVYSLGVMGYELLAGRRPLALEKRPLPQALRAICEEDPQPLSSLDIRLRGDIETIIAKAMEKERERRYPSAAALAGDIRRYLADEPIEARRPSTWYQLRRFARRNRVLVGGVVATFIVLVLGIIATTTQMLRARAAEVRAIQAGENETHQRQRAEQALATSTIAQADALVSAGRVVEARPLYDRAGTMLDTLGLSNFPAEIGQFTAEVAAASPAFTTAPHPDRMTAVVVTPDGKYFVTTSYDHSVRVWDAFSGAAVRTLEGGGDLMLCVAISPDGMTVAAAGGDADRGVYQHPNPDSTIHLWDLATGKPLGTLAGHTAAVRTLAFSPDGATLASAGDDKTIRLWNWKDIDHALLHAHTMPAVSRGIVYVGGDRLLCAGGEKSIRMIDVNDGSTVRILPGHNAPILALALSSDGHSVASASEDRIVKLWNLDTGTELHTLAGHGDVVNAVAFSRDGHRLLSGSSDGSARLWDADNGIELRKLCGSAGPVLGAAFLPDGQSAVTCGWSGDAQMWDIAAAPEVRTFRGHTAFVRSVAFSPDGLIAASGSWDRTARVWDVATGKTLRKLEGHRGYVHAVAFSPDGKLLATASIHQVRVWNIASGTVAFDVREEATARTVQFSPDGKTLIAGAMTKAVQLIDASSGTVLKNLGPHSAGVMSVAMSPDGKWILAGCEDGSLKLWNAVAGTEAATFAGHKMQITSVAISPDGKTALTGSWDQTLKLWELATGRELRTLEGHRSADGMVWSVAYSPDGTTAISGGQDDTFRFWNLADGTNFRTISVHAGQVYGIAFRPDGRAVLTADADGTIQFYDFSRAYQYRTLQPLAAAARQSPDAASANTLGQWFALRGMNAQACDCFARAGDHASALPSARSLWMCGQTEAALAAFATARQRHEAPDAYIDLCIDAIRTPSTQP